MNQLIRHNWVSTLTDCSVSTLWMARYVAEGKSAGMLTLVSRRGKIAHLATNGYMDIAAQTPMREDTIFRIYSMTKAITSVALMALLGAIALLQDYGLFQGF